MTYTEAEAYINGIQKFTVKHSLAHTRELLRLLGEPQGKIKIIHVAGTNGKGSTCNYLRGLLLAAGYRVGMFTSPHLVSMRERIVLNDEMISEQDFLSCFDTLLAVLQDCGLAHPTFFEFLFLLAMVYYGKEKPDFLILETGLGGRLDATNVFSAPVMTIITQIGLDHVQYLGDTIEKIAAEKAGIIKAGVPLVYVKKEDTVSRILEEKAKKEGVKAYNVNKNTAINVNISNKSIDFSYNSLYDNYIDISLPTYARYQAENAALAMRAFELLVGKQKLTPAFLQETMRHISWDGRMEPVADRIYLDGAHNEDGIKAFLESVPYIPLSGKRILLFSVVDDKSYETMTECLIQSGLFAVYIVANIRDSRGLSEEDLRRLFSRRGIGGEQIAAYTSVPLALGAAKELMAPQDLLFCVGSLYLIGEIKAHLFTAGK